MAMGVAIRSPEELAGAPHKRTTCPASAVETPGRHAWTMHNTLFIPWFLKAREVPISPCGHRKENTHLLLLTSMTSNAENPTYATESHLGTRPQLPVGRNFV